MPGSRAERPHDDVVPRSQLPTGPLADAECFEAERIVKRDRLQSAAYELVLDGESYRRRQKPGLDIGTTGPRTRRRRCT
jgi:hypothetical protein